MPKSNYMSKQPDISHSMRSILVDWLVEVGEEYKLQTETLYLAVSYIDRGGANIFAIAPNIFTDNVSAQIPVLHVGAAV